MNTSLTATSQRLNLSYEEYFPLKERRLYPILLLVTPIFSWLGYLSLIGFVLSTISTPYITTIPYSVYFLLFLFWGMFSDTLGKKLKKIQKKKTFIETTTLLGKYYHYLPESIQDEVKHYLYKFILSSVMRDAWQERLSLSQVKELNIPSSESYKSEKMLLKESHEDLEKLLPKIKIYETLKLIDKYGTDYTLTELEKQKEKISLNPLRGNEVVDIDQTILKLQERRTDISLSVKEEFKELFQLLQQQEQITKQLNNWNENNLKMIK